MRPVSWQVWTTCFVFCLSGVAGSGCIRPLPIYPNHKSKKVAAEFPSLHGRVAIVGDGNNLDGNDATRLARYVEILLQKNLNRQVDFVPRGLVDKTLGDRDAGAPDYKAIGRDMQADFLIAITLSNLTLREGAMYKGRADVLVGVYDCKDDGKLVYRKIWNEFEYPKMAGPSIVDTTEGKFRNLFLTIVSRHIAELFYPFDPSELAVLHPTILSQ